jgi:hypothetical protein
MFRFLNNRCRNDLKRFSNERSIKQNPASLTPLIDFAKEYPEIFDCLWAIFALQPSNSHPSEQFHRMEHHAHYDQTRLGHSNARGRYMMLQEYSRRKARREQTIQRAKDKSKPLKRVPKHNDRKDIVTMSGEQILVDANPYKEKELRCCLPADVLGNTPRTFLIFCYYGDYY